MPPFEIREIRPDDREWIKKFMLDAWGSELVVSRGVIHQAWQLPGFIAHRKRKLAGLVTYNIEGSQCEIVTLDSTMENIGVGWANIQAVREVARKAGCTRLWLITTNDNIHAIRYYQKRGFTIAAVHVNALEHSRKLKPQIPLIGNEGLPLRDEIEFEMSLLDE